MGARIDPNARFDRERKKAAQSENAQQQQVREAIARKFASQGLQGSGADIKVTQQAGDEGAKRLSDRMGDISSAQEQDALQRQGIEDAKKFATSERVGTQDFQSKETALQRALQQGQFDKQFGFQEKQATTQGEQFASQLSFQEKQAIIQGEQFDKTFGAQQSQFDAQLKQQKDQFKISNEQFLKDFNLKKKTSEEQTNLAKAAAKLATQSIQIEKMGEAVNAFTNFANMVANDTITPEQASVIFNSTVGSLGPEIMKFFPGDPATLFGTSAGAETEAAPKKGDFKYIGTTQYYFDGERYTPVRR